MPGISDSGLWPPLLGAVEPPKLSCKGSIDSESVLDSEEAFLSKEQNRPGYYKGRVSADVVSPQNSSYLEHHSIL